MNVFNRQMPSVLMRMAALRSVVLVAALCVAACAQEALAQGRYFWVPDSLESAVSDVLDGKRAKKADPGIVDISEMTVYRGDTIPMILKSRNLGRYDRGLFNYLFIPKGMWSFGLTASYGQFSTSDLQLFDLLSDVDISATAISVKPYVNYSIRNNLAVGLRLNYTTMQGNVDNLRLKIDDDMNFSLNDIMYRSESYAAALTLTQYIGLSRRGRFGVTNEVQLSFASGNSDFARPYNSVLRTTHSTYMDIRLTFSPGLCVFVMKNVSCNLSFGIFGFYLRNEKQRVDGQRAGNRLTSGANFRFNIFNIAFGLAVHV